MLPARPLRARIDQIAAPWGRRPMPTPRPNSQVAQQERIATVTRQRVELVMSELKTLPDTVPTYKQIGKA
jgi:hypothetical protein